MDEGRREAEELRQELGRLDAQLIAALHRRARTSKALGQLRGEHGPSLPLTGHASIRAMVAQAKGDMPEDALRDIFREIYAACLALELPARVAFVGPDGGPGYAAVRGRFGRGPSLFAVESTAAALEEVTRKRAQLAVVPFETTTEGRVRETLLALLASDLRIAEVLDAKFHLHLMNRSGRADGIEKVYATPGDHARCQRFLSGLAPRASVIDVATPLLACERAAEEPTAAALASEAFGGDLGLEVAHRNVLDAGESLRPRTPSSARGPRGTAGRGAKSSSSSELGRPGLAARCAEGLRRARRQPHEHPEPSRRRRRMAVPLLRRDGRALADRHSRHGLRGDEADDPLLQGARLLPGALETAVAQVSRMIGGGLERFTGRREVRRRWVGTAEAQRATSAVPTRSGRILPPVDAPVTRRPSRFLAGRQAVSALASFLWPLALLLALACGGKGGVTAEAKKVDLDADPIALLPPAAIVVAGLDARAVFGNARLGPRLSELSEAVVPLGEDAGFRASRDVDRMITAAYATGDGVAVIRGRFDEAKIAATATAKSGAAVVHGSYGGRATHTVGRIAFAVLTPNTVVAGTGDGLRRVLDRVSSLQAAPRSEAPLDRAVPPWMSDTLATLDTHAAAIAVAGDFSTQPIAAATIGSLKLPWLEGLRLARALVSVDGPNEPDLHVTATLTYADPARAEEAASSARMASRWLKVLGPFLGGVTLGDLEITTDASDARCKFAVDDRTLDALLSLAPRFLRDSSR